MLLEMLRKFGHHKIQILLGLGALIVSATQLGRADVELVFGARDEGDYVLIGVESKDPLRYSLKRCSSEDKCTQLGKKGVYSVSEIREKMIELAEKRSHSKNPKDPRPGDYLRDLIEAIERPSIDWESRSYHYRVKGGSIDQFSKVINKNL